jgi:ankyrin repeat protein
MLGLTKKGKILSAVKSANVFKVKDLLAKGVDPNTKDLADRPLLLFAIARDSIAIIEALLDAGADPNAEFQSSTGLHMANSLSAMEVLLKAGADPNYRNNSGQTPMMIHASEHNMKAVNLLKKYGATI